MKKVRNIFSDKDFQRYNKLNEATDFVDADDIEKEADDFQDASENLTEDVTDQVDKKGNLYLHVDDPSNPYTYFEITDIENHGYSVESGRKASFGKTYYEIDSSSLVITDINDRNDDENTTYSSFVMSDGE